MRRLGALSVLTLAAATAVTLWAPLGAGADPGGSSSPQEYVVVYTDGAKAAESAIGKAGGRVVGVNDKLRIAKVSTTDRGFVAKARRAAGISGVVRNHAIGTAKPGMPHRFAAERPSGVDKSVGARAGKRNKHSKKSTEPLSNLQWDMAMMDVDKAHKRATGRGVDVGIIDTGIDASHPDIAPNFNAALSRNFTTDIPSVDGPCEVEPDGSCEDPANVDESGHGTHVAGIVAAADTGIGISGVAPEATLVNLRAGQDSGYFFFFETVAAITYAADNGIDVVNMSFYTDPWLFNCRANPADSPEQQAEQRAIIAGMRRALNYAHNNGVTLLGALGNANQDLGKPPVDNSSPDYPEGTAYPRTIDNDTCLDLPVEGPHVIGVSAVGPSGNRSFYSNYGVEQISVAAPGGATTDGSSSSITNAILSTYPLKVLQGLGRVDANGEINPAFADRVFKSCTKAGVCGYYTYLQGTSMASPHAAGVAALIASRFGEFDREHGGKTMKPNAVERKLLNSAAERPCPAATPACEGTAEFNGFYGNGIVDAYRAVR